jgi:NAD(P)H-hydrate epimerase
VDRTAIEAWGLPGIVLMENAARGIAEVAHALLGGRPGGIAIVCGPGNNGGDGFAAGRHLQNLGHDAEIQLLARPEDFREGSDARINLDVIRRMNLPIRREIDLQGADLVIDALFGTGLCRALEEPYRSAVEAINAESAPVMAVDIPSGLDADSGAIHGAAVRAACTATMVAPKLGFERGEGPRCTGEVRVVDIGVPAAIVAELLENGL